MVFKAVILGVVDLGSRVKGTGLRGLHWETLSLWPILKTCMEQTWGNQMEAGGK